MQKFSVDLLDLQSGLNKKKTYRLSEVQHRIEKVAFDVVRFMDSEDLDKLWVVNKDDEGEYIVAMYEDDSGLVSESQVKKASSNPWEARVDAKKQYVNVFYNKAPIKKLALNTIGIPSEDGKLICKYLPIKLAEDDNFRNSFIKSLSKSEKESLAEENPNLVAGF